jgi:hypothetical protein
MQKQAEWIAPFVGAWGQLVKTSKTKWPKQVRFVATSPKEPIQVDVEVQAKPTYDKISLRIPVTQTSVMLIWSFLRKFYSMLGEWLCNNKANRCVILSPRVSLEKDERGVFGRVVIGIISLRG